MHASIPQVHGTFYAGSAFPRLQQRLQTMRTGTSTTLSRTSTSSGSTTLSRGTPAPNGGGAPPSSGLSGAAAAIAQTLYKIIHDRTALTQSRVSAVITAHAKWAASYGVGSASARAALKGVQVRGQGKVPGPLQKIALKKFRDWVVAHPQQATASSPAPGGGGSTALNRSGGEAAYSPPTEPGYLPSDDALYATPAKSNYKPVLYGVGLIVAVGLLAMVVK